MDYKFPDFDKITTILEAIYIDVPVLHIPEISSRDINSASTPSTTSNTDWKETKGLLALSRKLLLEKKNRNQLKIRFKSMIFLECGFGFVRYWKYWFFWEKTNR